MSQEINLILLLRSLLKLYKSSTKIEKKEQIKAAIERIQPIVSRSNIHHLPQEGPQEEFAKTDADILIYGGAAGGGKTFALLTHPLQFINNERFGAVIFRRTYQQITNEGGMWDESHVLYPVYGAIPNYTNLLWKFPSGSTISFAHFQHEKDIDNWRGAQIACILIDQLEQFTQRQFWGLVERNRSMCGVQPHIRATCNPRIGWLGEFISWWINQDTGYPIAERAGVKRWFIRLDDKVIWGDSPEELKEKYPDIPPISVAFIPSKVTDNKILLETNPTYIANLMALPRVERLRQLGGNWLVNEADGIFDVSQIKIATWFPETSARVRYWDKAGTEEGGAYSCGVRISKDVNGMFFIEDVARGQWTSLQRNRIIKQTAAMDAYKFPGMQIWLEQEPGSGGKESAEISIRELAGYDVHVERVTGDKITRANPFAAQVEAGNVYICQAEWNKEYLDEMRAFPASVFKDQIDGSSGGFNKVALKDVSLRIHAPKGNSIQDKYPKGIFSNEG